LCCSISLESYENKIFFLKLTLSAVLLENSHSSNNITKSLAFALLLVNSQTFHKQNIYIMQNFDIILIEKYFAIRLRASDRQTYVIV